MEVNKIFNICFVSIYPIRLKRFDVFGHMFSCLFSQIMSYEYQETLQKKDIYVYGVIVQMVFIFDIAF